MQKTNALSLAALLSAFVTGASGQEAPAELPSPLPIEEMGVRAISEPGPRIYLSGWRGMSVFSGDDLTFLGSIGSGSVPKLLPSSAADAPIYIATSYYSRGMRGQRQDVLEYYDRDTLALQGEIELPPHVTMNQSLRMLIQPTHDGKFMLIQNATPASSVTIVDIQGGKTVAEINTPGCWGIYPATTTAAFSTICGDGTFATYTLNEDGSDATRSASEKIFDVDEDALFSHGERVGDQYVFVSFTGNLYTMDLDGPTPVLADKTSIVDGIEGNWRPGGHQLSAYLPGTGKLYVLMHPNGMEGSHKIPAKEIWTIDIATKEVVARTKSEPLIVITPYPGHNLLYGMDDAETMIVRYLTDPANGNAPVQQKSVKSGLSMRHLEVR